MLWTKCSSLGRNFNNKALNKQSSMLDNGLGIVIYIQAGSLCQSAYLT